MTSDAGNRHHSAHSAEFNRRRRFRGEACFMLFWIFGLSRSNLAPSVADAFTCSVRPCPRQPLWSRQTTIWNSRDIGVDCRVGLKGFRSRTLPLWTFEKSDASRSLLTTSAASSSTSSNDRDASDDADAVASPKKESIQATHRTTSPALNLAPHRRSKVSFSVAKSERRALARRHGQGCTDAGSDGGSEEEESMVGSRIPCGTCGRPLVICVCEALPGRGAFKIDTNTEIIVLQHPREFKKRNYSTVPLMRLVLSDASVTVRVGLNFDPNVILGRPGEYSEDGIGEDDDRPLLLFPGPESIALDTAEGMEELGIFTTADKGGLRQSRSQKRQRLVLVDGTWTQAKSIVRNNPWLENECRTVRLTSGESTPSVYDQVRREPEAQCLSTLEACARTLRALEPSNECTAADHLEDTLLLFVEKQMRVRDEKYSPRTGSAHGRKFAKNKRRREIEVAMFEE